MHLKCQSYMILLRDEKEVINDASVSSLIDFARKKLLSFADPSWIAHSPHLFKNLKSTLERMASRRQQNTGTSQPAALSFRPASTLLVPLSALSNPSPLPAQRGEVIPYPSQQSPHMSEPATPHSATLSSPFPPITIKPKSRVVTQSATPVRGSVRTAHVPLIACCAEASHYCTLCNITGRATINTNRPYHLITHTCGKGWVAAYDQQPRWA